MMPNCLRFAALMLSLILTACASQPVHYYTLQAPRAENDTATLSPFVIDLQPVVRIKVQIRRFDVWLGRHFQLDADWSLTTPQVQPSSRASSPIAPGSGNPQNVGMHRITRSVIQSQPGPKTTGLG